MFQKIKSLVSLICFKKQHQVIITPTHRSSTVFNKRRLVTICLLSCFAFTIQAQSSNLSGLVCDTNDYALCSHAKCGCFDEQGNSTDCTEYPSDDSKNVPTSSWSMCECPIVENQPSPNSAYNVNYAAANLSCEQRSDPLKNPSIDYQLPDFVDAKTELYSTYSYGDSIANHEFGTKASAKSAICQSPDLFADCLSMACYIPKGQEHAVCYCKNRSENRACQDQDQGWNTFGTECDLGQCNQGKNQIWSAACINDTKTAIAQIALFMDESGQKAPQIPAYCDAQ